jgi:curved DNA-binding protein CbpA
MTETLSENPQRTTTYYDLLKLHPSASPQQIRQAFRDLSKLYHPDTTSLPASVATAQFQQLNEAYATLSNPDRRFAYDRKIGYSRFTVIQPPADLNRPVSANRKFRSSAYLDPTDRPLSAGELFALFMLILTFAGCLIIAVAIAYARGGAALQMIEPPV